MTGSILLAGRSFADPLRPLLVPRREVFWRAAGQWFRRNESKRKLLESVFFYRRCCLDVEPFRDFIHEQQMFSSCIDGPCYVWELQHLHTCIRKRRSYCANIGHLFSRCCGGKGERGLIHGDFVEKSLSAFIANSSSVNLENNSERYSWLVRGTYLGCFDADRINKRIITQQFSRSTKK